MMSFLESPRFPEKISYGAVGGPVYKTDVVIVNSGFEQRNAVWSQARASYNVAHAARDRDMMAEIIAFFRSVKGRAIGFRFKDWLDYKATNVEGFLGTGVGTGLPTYQLKKKYEAGVNFELRDIRKPVAGTVRVYLNNALLTEGTSAGQWQIDNSTGIVTFAPAVTKTVNSAQLRLITDITQAANGVVTTSVNHGFNTGDQIKLTDVNGMIEVNDLYFNITVLTPTTFELNVDTTTFTAYTSSGLARRESVTQTNPVQINADAHGFANGDVIYIVSNIAGLNNQSFTIQNVTTNQFEIDIDGTGFAISTSTSLRKYYQSTDDLNWDGEFDVPVRFDTDQIEVEIIAPEVQGWGSIPLVEIRT
jgi:uncharacterized protein (TIGR02217 family)